MFGAECWLLDVEFSSSFQLPALLVSTMFVRERESIGTTSSIGSLALPPAI